MADHECIACNEYHDDLRQCEYCEEDVCPACDVRHEQRHIFGPAMFEAFEAGDGARMRRLVHAVNGTTPELVPFVSSPTTTEV